jgi:hypothetical protein
MPARLEREQSFLDAALLPKNTSLLSNGYRPVAVPDRGRHLVGATWAAPPELTARRDAKVVPMKKALIEIFA